MTSTPPRPRAWARKTGFSRRRRRTKGSPPEVLQGLKEGDHVKGEGLPRAVEPHLPGQEEDAEEVGGVVGHGDHVGPLVPPGPKSPQGHPQGASSWGSSPTGRRGLAVFSSSVRRASWASGERLRKSGWTPPRRRSSAAARRSFPDSSRRSRGASSRPKALKRASRGRKKALPHLLKPHGPKPPFRHLQGGKELLGGGLVLGNLPVDLREKAAVGLSGEPLHPLAPRPHLPGHGHLGLGKGEVPHQGPQLLQNLFLGHLAGVAGGETGDLGGHEGVPIPVPADPAPEADRAFEAGPLAVDPLQSGLQPLHHLGDGPPEGGGQVVKPPLDLVLHAGPGLAHLLGGVEEGHPGVEPGPVPLLQLPL
jgi:hypothetical protein